VQFHQFLVFQFEEIPDYVLLFMQNRQILGLKVKKQALQDVKDEDKILNAQKTFAQTQS